MKELKKVSPPENYPPEEGCYLRGNDNSPAAVVVILNYRREETPKEIENLVRVGVESGAALAGTLQTENVGLEKVICNLIANPNIRYLILFGPESPGHSTGDAIISLYQNGIDEKNRIIATIAPAAYLANLPKEWIERFRSQTRLINLLNEGSPEVLREAVWATYQEEPVNFREYQLYDPGAYEAEAICQSITWKLKNPVYAPRNDEEEQALQKAQALIEKLKKRAESREQREREAGNTD